jgi:thioester reductase-like protein
MAAHSLILSCKVHWVYPYHKLRSANVLSTLTAVELASSEAKPKLISFVSSTSAVDVQHYVRLSDDLADTEAPGVPEDDDLEGARYELKIGYGQSKWVAEKLLMEAAVRGLAVNIVRPGYVVGDSVSAGKHLPDGATSPAHCSSPQLRIPTTLYGAWSRVAYSLDLSQTSTTQLTWCPLIM